MSNPFAFNPPSLESSSQSPPASISSSDSSTSLDADASIEGFYSLLLASPEMDSPVIKYLANRLLDLRIRKSLRVELSALGGELRDEWKVRVGGVKADWMARIIPELEEQEEDEAGDANDGNLDGTGSTGGDDSRSSEPLPPTILSDVDDRNLMSERVDSVVEQEFEERLTEAEGTLRKGVVSKEKLELEIFLGELLLEARDEVDTDEEVIESIRQSLLETLEALGDETPPYDESLGLEEDLSTLKVASE